MKTYTNAEKKKYFSDLRDRWNKSKKLAQEDKEAEAMWREAGGKVSYTSFYFTLAQMRTLGLEGTPYVDCKTYNGWKDSGFIVKKGESSKISGVTWISTKKDDEEEDGYKFPKSYHLFHKSQVQTL